MSTLKKEECSGDNVENNKKWSESVESLLECDNGRHRFLQFLTKRNLVEGERTILFWESLNDFQKLLKEETDKNTILKKKKSVIDYADEYVNFTREENQQLAKIMDEEDKESVHEILENAKKTASGLIGLEYQIFMAWLEMDQYENAY
ncbi:uncharacterized protein LOC106673853 [Cimex lectularius]|uniref:RGS domain-containing protein n=1 Tax=Cimex lectularius TaxID=79782 RepID=A0A8I6SCC4_CIMLE|nr:uncharacterized protein LOC106673853 [Cimex lectularius]